MITSVQNPGIKNLIQLQKKGRTRKEQGLFVVEGPKMFSEIPEGQLVKAYVSESFIHDGRHMEMFKKVPYELVSDRVFREAADTVNPQGILAVVKQPAYTVIQLLEEKEELSLLLLEDIQDPGNLGTILRTAEAAGISGIIMSKETVDIFNPKVIRSTMGAIFRVPFVYAEDFQSELERIQKETVVYAAHLDGKSYYDEVKYGPKTAVLIGNEARGLKEETAAKADILVKIPMEGQAESLNAAVAASVFMYERYRQRRK